MKGRYLLLITLIVISLSLASCAGQHGPVSAGMTIDVSVAWMNEGEEDLLVLVMVDDAPSACVEVKGEHALLEKELFLNAASSVVDVYFIIPGDDGNRSDETAAEVIAQASLTVDGGHETERKKIFELGRGTATLMHFDLSPEKKTGGRSVSMLKEKSGVTEDKGLSDAIDIIIRKPPETDPVISYLVKSDNIASILTRIIE